MMMRLAEQDWCLDGFNQLCGEASVVVEAATCTAADKVRTLLFQEETSDLCIFSKSLVSSTYLMDGRRVHFLGGK